LSKPAAREERRWATLLFADLSGFTALSEGLDPEDVKALAHHCTERLSQEVQRFGGTVITIAGDQVAAAFGAPVAHEDDAERAVRAALAMRDSDLRDRSDRPLRVHIGINTGEVMAGLIGAEGSQEFAVMGDTTNVASRLMSAAPPGSVLVGEETWRATRGLVKYRDLPPILVKGKQQPVAVWEAVEVLAAPKSRPLGTAPLVGRDEELGLLSGVWLRVVREAQPHLVTVLGDPGLGKSRLAAEFEKRFCAGARVIHGRCLPYGEALGYWALTTALKEAAGITADSEGQASRCQLGEKVREVLGPESEADPAELTRHLALLSGLDTPEERSANPPDQRTLHASVRRFFEALARQQPLCWMIEDIHWADEALLDLIEFVGARAKEAPLLILAQARPSLLEKRRNWGAGVPGFHSLPLQPLNAQHGRDLIVALCRERGLAEAMADQVGRGAGGNPLFAEELVAMIAERGQGAGVPSAIKALIAARLDALPTSERHLLQLAAVFGKAFWVGGLRSLEPGAQLDEELEKLEQKDLLRAQPRSQFRREREFAFKHDLIRDVAYEMLPRAERRSLHGRIVDWIERAAGESVENYLDQIAHHAIAAGQEERGLSYLIRAAERAGRLAAHRPEAALLLQAMSMAQKLGQQAFATELRGRRGTALWHVGQWDEARRELEEVDKMLPVDQIERRAELCSRLASVCFYTFDLENMRQYATRAIALAKEAHRPDLVAEATCISAFAVQSEGNLAGAIELHQQARLVADGRPFMSRTGAALTLYLAGRLDEAVEAGAEGLRMARVHNHSWALMNGLPHFALALAAKGRYSEAIRMFEEAHSFGTEHGIWPFLARSISFSAGFHLDIYDFPGNQQLAEQARESGLSGDFLPTVVSAGLDLLFNYIRRQEVVQAESLCSEVAAKMEELGGWHAWLWRLRLEQARAELAVARTQWADGFEIASRVIETSERRGRPRYWILGLWSRAQAQNRLGKKAEALADLEAALKLARRLGDPAMHLRVAAVTLEIESHETLAREAGAIAQQINAALPDDTLRQRFESAEPVRLIRKLAPNP
jgi:class 3 adenylate cyclase/tetratricopeptide (TPR) repeat protein